MPTPRLAAAVSVTLVLVAAVSLRSAPRPAPPPAPAAAAQVAPPATTPPRSPRNASYSIDAQLDPATRTIKGTELLTWRNITSRETRELRFHLYYNAWRNTDSTWLRERALARGAGPGALPASDWGWTDVGVVRLVPADAPPIDLTARVRFIAPDDGNAQDRTVMAITLDEPVAPGQTINLQIGWTAHVPRTFARTGALGRYFFIAQWFPKIGVLEDAGWNCHQFHSATEFFADFGVYDVHLTVPTGWVVGATGVELDRTDDPSGTTRHHYYQADVHDFAWTTSPDYLVRTARFEHPPLPPVEMRLLLQPEHAGQAARHFDATRATLRDYGTWFGPYPYGHITIVDPAWQSGTGGMEYPTLFTAGSAWLAPEGVTRPEGVTVHEAGHQFWYGIVATNEFEDAWMDEGFNTYSTARAIEEAFSPNFLSDRFFGGFVPWVYRDIPLARATDGNGLSSYRAVAKSDVQATPSWRYWPGTAGGITYSKTALWLNTLERYLGWTTMQRIMSTYFERWKFRHPSPQDFFDVANEVSGQDLTWFFDQVYRSSNVFDYGVQSLSSGPADAHGFFGEGPARALATRDGGGLFHTSLVVRRYGEAMFPVDVLVTFEDGTQVRERWNGRDRWRLYQYQSSRARGVRPGGSRPRPAARRRLHEQQLHAEAPGGRGRTQVVTRLARVAAGRAAHLRVLRVRARRTRPKELP